MLTACVYLLKSGKKKENRGWEWGSYAHSTCLINGMVAAKFRYFSTLLTFVSGNKRAVMLAA